MNGPDPHSHDIDLELAFEFLNTRELESGALVDRLRTPSDAFAWFRNHHVVHRELLDEEQRKLEEVQGGDERALAKIRKVRDALREVTDAVVEKRAAVPSALAEVNRALRAREIIQLEPTEDGVQVGHRHVGDPIDDGLARLADPIVREISAGRPERLRVCDNPTCRWVFYDDSPTGRRRWCDMATCGNRAKAARHRARRKAAAGQDPDAVA